jgi:hypothetical protein
MAQRLGGQGRGMVRLFGHGGMLAATVAAVERATVGRKIRMSQALRPA